jgi:hypothetical protein
MPGTISIRCLGSFGRFGNQCFQYAAARGYAESIGATLETPWWVGQTLFGLNDPPISKMLPSLSLDEHPNGRVDVDLYGYFQHAKFYSLYTLTKLREWFKPTRYWTDHFPAHKGHKLVSHIRRGDYLTTYNNIFCTIAEEAYVQAMKTAGYDPSKRVEVREDKPNNYYMPDLEFATDFFTLFNADVLFRANSTFSWWAATLGHASKVYSPVVEGMSGPQTDVKFIAGNWPRCVSMDSVSDYHIAP